MIASAIINTAIGAGLKLGAVLINAWLDNKRQTQMLLAARDHNMLQALADNQREQASDPFVQVTRRVLFLMITLTLCYLMIYYAMNPTIEYDVIMPINLNNGAGLFAWLFGTKTFEVVTLTGGLLLMNFMDLAFMVIGFYAVPNRR